jgi:hypothetical protein
MINHMTAKPGKINNTVALIHLQAVIKFNISKYIIVPANCWRRYSYLFLTRKTFLKQSIIKKQGL